MNINKQTASQEKVNELFERLSRRNTAAMSGGCPVEMTASFVDLCLTQSCGKCVPCRIGLDRLNELLVKVLDFKGSMKDIDQIEVCARSIYNSADCAIGFEAAKLVLDGMETFRDDYESHITKGVCTEHFRSIPCVAGCPAKVDIPGYIALTNEGRYADAVRLIRKNNPFPSVCGLICEHPCEAHCRRNIVDDAINIRGLKRFAAENAGDVPVPECAPSNGKTVAVIGGGPSGLTAAYFLQLKGYAVTIYEAHKRLGGMLRYGIPIYRLPDEILDADINAILSTGINVVMETKIGRDISFETIRKQYDSVYISIGAQDDNKLGVPGEEATGVLSAVELLGNLGDNNFPNFSGKRVVIVGGGNVAMDAVRSSKRLGASSVTCVYRRRIADMTALPEEIEGAIAENCNVLQLLAPVQVMSENNKVTGLMVKPQISGPIQDNRPKPVPAATQDAYVIPCDIIVVAVGQKVDSADFASNGVETKRNRIVAADDTSVPGMPGVFAGGDSCSGPATAIKAIECGRVAAHNIDEYFGFDTNVDPQIDIPVAYSNGRPAWGRNNMRERDAAQRQNDFELMEICMTKEEAKAECARCLRCDHFGYGAFRNGR